MGKAVGTTCGLAGSDAKSMLSGPIRMTPEKNSLLARLIVKPELDMLENGVTLPGGLCHITCRLAGSRTWLPMPQVSMPGAVGAPPPTGPPAVCTDNSLLSATAVKSGGADPNGVKNPSLHTGLPTAVPAGSATVPESSVKAAGFRAAAPLPAQLKSLTGRLSMVCAFKTRLTGAEGSS